MELSGDGKSEKSGKENTGTEVAFLLDYLPPLVVSPQTAYPLRIGASHTPNSAPHFPYLYTQICKRVISLQVQHTQLKQMSQSQSAVLRSLLPALLLWAGIVLLMVLAYILDYVGAIRLPGVLPRKAGGILGILTAPFVHANLEHLFSNIFPLWIMGTIMQLYYRAFALRAVLGIYLLTGFWVWIAARDSMHVGASGVVYGIAFFLFWIGIFRWKSDKRAAYISFVVCFLYVGIMEGLLPTSAQPHTSWESHSLGALAGLLMAFVYRKHSLPPPDYGWQQQPDNPEETGSWDYKQQIPPPEGFGYD